MRKSDSGLVPTFKRQPRLQLASATAALVIFAFPPKLVAQQSGRIEISADKVCSTCEIRRHPVTSLGETTGPAILAPNPIIEKDVNGRYWVSSPSLRGRILVFGPKGEFEEELGGIGQGPGEFQFIFSLASLADGRVVVVDNGNARVSLFDLDLSLSNDFTIEGPAYDVVGLPGDLLAVNAAISTRARAGMPLHIVSEEGDVLKSLGEESAIFRRDAVALLQRSLAPSSNGFWAAHRTAYLIDLWDEGGVRRQTLARSVPWFTSHAGNYAPSCETPPPSFVADVHQVGSRLWVALVVADSEWCDGLDQVPTSRGRMGLRISRLSDFFDGVIEVIDLETHQLLMSQSFDDAIFELLPGLEAATYREDDIGNSFIDIWRLEATNTSLRGGRR